MVVATLRKTLNWFNHKNNLWVCTTGKVKVWIQHPKTQVLRWWLESILPDSASCFVLCGPHFQAGTPQVRVWWPWPAPTHKKRPSLPRAFQPISQGWLIFTGLDWTPAQILCLPFTHDYGHEKAVPWLALGHIPTFGARRCLWLPNRGRNEVATSCILRRRNRCSLRKQRSPEGDISCSLLAWPDMTRAS